MKRKTTATVPVTTRALFQRISRQLAKQGKELKAARGAHAQTELGAYYIIDNSTHTVTAKRVDLEQLGRETGTLAAHEHVV